MSTVRERYGGASREQLFGVIETLGTELETSRERSRELDAQLEASRRRIETLERRVEELEAELRRVRIELEKARTKGSGGGGRASHGTARAKKRPGRKRGRGIFRHREAPALAELSEPPIDVPLSPECEHCGGSVSETGSEMVTNTELPEPPKPVIKAFVMHSGRCDSCGRQMRSRHPEVADDQTGATAHRVGMRAYAAAHALHYDVGVPVRKVPRVLELLTGIRITQGALTQDALERSRASVGEMYERLREAVRTRPAVHTDDTSWRVSGAGAFLMAFDTEGETLYQVREHHTNAEVREILPADYGGTLISDGSSVYEARVFSGVKKQKCLAHILRLIHKALEDKRGRARSFCKRLKELLQQAVGLHAIYRKSRRMGLEEYLAFGEDLERQISEHLQPRELSDPDDRRLRRELWLYHQKGSLLRFLRDPSLEPTNNPAELALRGMVIVRDLWQGSKNTPGAYATAAFKSVIQTLKKRGIDVIEGLLAVFRGEGLEALQPG